MGRGWLHSTPCTVQRKRYTVQVVASHKLVLCSARSLPLPVLPVLDFTANVFAPPTHITMSLTPRLPSTHPHLFSHSLHTRWDALPDSCPTLDIWTTDSPLLIIGSHVWNTPNPVTGKMSCNGELQEQVGMTGRRDGSEAACHGQASPIRATNT